MAAVRLVQLMLAAAPALHGKVLVDSPWTVPMGCGSCFADFLPIYCLALSMGEISCSMTLNSTQINLSTK